MFKYWRVWYTSYEGNSRWFMVKTTDDWDEADVLETARKRNSFGGVGDDPAEIDSIEEGYDADGIIEYDVKYYNM